MILKSKHVGYFTYALLWIVVLLVVFVASWQLISMRQVVSVLDSNTHSVYPNPFNRTLNYDYASLPEHFSYFSDKAFYERAFARNEDILIEKEKVYGGIVPHHLLPADHIAYFYTGLKQQRVSTVVILGPNHFNAGTATIQTSRARWNTPYGELLPDLETIDELTESNIAVVEEAPFENEHSITSQVAFIKRMWPHARVVPLVLSLHMTEEESRELAHMLHSVLDNNALVLASVDFSHNQYSWVADFHDAYSIGVIEQFDKGRVFGLEIDSPPSIYTLLEYLDQRGARYASRRVHTNAAHLLDQLDSSENTSYLFEYFVSGDNESTPTASVLLFPDALFGRDVARLSERAGTSDYPFKLLEGREGQFFRGTDAITINLEGPLTTHQSPIQKEISFAFDPSIAQTLAKYNITIAGLANNHGYDQGIQGFDDSVKHLNEAGIDYFGHPVKETRESVLFKQFGEQTIAFVGFNITDHAVSEDTMKDTVFFAQDNADFVITSMHWGVEYIQHPTKEQKQLARVLIDAGADIIVGHHPHVVQTLEEYNDRLIFYSLGNFIFDQYFSPETQIGLGLGLVIHPDDYQVHLIPYTIPQSQVQLMGYEERAGFLKQLALNSRLDNFISKAVQLGVISIGQ